MTMVVGLRDAATYLHISVDTLRRRMSEGKIRYFRDVRRVFFDQADLDRYLESLRVEEAMVRG